MIELKINMNITFFKTIKRIVSRENIIHFTRFAIIDIPNVFGIYIHRIYKEDKDNALHNHPWNFLGIVLSGAYTEETVQGVKLKKVGTVSIGGRHFFHKIKSIERDTTTLFFVWGKHKPWGYMTFTNSEEFRKNKHNNSK